MQPIGSDHQIRLAEVMASLSLATDLGLGQPLQHELGVCLSALELADRLGCSADECSEERGGRHQWRAAGAWTSSRASAWRSTADTPGSGCEQ